MRPSLTQNPENPVVLGKFHDRVAGSTLPNHRHARSISTHDRDARSPERHHGDSDWTSTHHRDARSISTHDRDAYSSTRHDGDACSSKVSHRDARLPRKKRTGPVSRCSRAAAARAGCGQSTQSRTKNPAKRRTTARETMADEGRVGLGRARITVVSG